MIHRNNIIVIFAAVGLILFNGCDLAAPTTGRSTTSDAHPVSVSRSASGDLPLRMPSSSSGSSSGLSAAVRQACQRDLDAHQDYRFVFDMQSIDGESLQHRDYVGRVLIVDLWATWCPPCRQEVPHFVDLQERYGSAGLSIVGLNYERAYSDRGAEKTIRKFLEQQPVNYPLAVGTPELKVQIPDFRGYPTTLFIDHTGTVRATVVGARPLAYLESMVQILLAESGRQSGPEQNQFVGSSTLSLKANPAVERTVPETAAQQTAAVEDTADGRPEPQGTSRIQMNPFTEPHK